MPTLDPEYRYFHESWDALRMLDAQLMLFGPWFVYPRYAIQELWPPSSHQRGGARATERGRLPAARTRAHPSCSEKVSLKISKDPKYTLKAGVLRNTVAVKPWKGASAPLMRNERATHSPMVLKGGT